MISVVQVHCWKNYRWISWRLLVMMERRNILLILSGKNAEIAWYAWYGYVWCGVVWCGVVWCGVVWCGVVWCGVVWCGVVWCGVVVYGVVVYGMV